MNKIIIHHWCISHNATAAQLHTEFKCQYIEYRSDDVTKTFFAFQRFGYHVSVERDEKHSQPKFGGNQFMGPEIWPHEYLLSPIEINVNWPGSKQL